MAQSDMSGIRSRPSLIDHPKWPTVLLKGTASAVPQKLRPQDAAALPKAGVERKARND
jgi:hypothetical protein